jgi:membrane-associated phospholipid phosphatase
MEQIFQFDQSAFFAINHGWQNDFFDWLMPWWREKTTWIPLYVLLLALVWFRKSRRFFLCFVIGIGLTVGISDTVSSKVIKPSVERLRPCRTPDVQDRVTVRVNCGPGYSFPSSHATNHFAIGVFVMLALWSLLGPWRWLLPLWAGSISVGQVYVGVHFPIDITAGMLIGSAIGAGVAFGLKNVCKQMSGSVSENIKA